MRKAQSWSLQVTKGSCSPLPRGAAIWSLVYCISTGSTQCKQYGFLSPAVQTRSSGKHKNYSGSMEQRATVPCRSWPAPASGDMFCNTRGHAHRHSGKDPLGLIQHVLAVLVLWSGAGFHLRLGASDDSFPSILLHGPLDICLDLLPAAYLPPMQKRDAQHKFLQHGGTRCETFVLIQLHHCGRNYYIFNSKPILEYKTNYIPA